MNDFTRIIYDILNTFLGFWDFAGNYFIKFLSATVLVLVGWFIAKILSNLIKNMIKKIDINKVLSRIGMEKFLGRMGYKLDLGVFLGDMVKWIVFVGFFIVALNIIKLKIVTAFMFIILSSVVNIFIAIIILVVAVIVARSIKRFTIGAASAMKIKFGKLLGSAASAIVYFSAFITILGLFDITKILLNFVEIIIIGVVVAFSIAFGLAFGLGGKERAKEILEGMKKK